MSARPIRLCLTQNILGGQNVQFVDVGVKLRMIPTIGDDGVVTAELHPEYSEIEGITSTGYPIITNRKHVDTVLRVSDGQTIVLLGGLMMDTSNETITKVPGLAGHSDPWETLSKQADGARQRTRCVLLDHATRYIRRATARE